MKRNFEKIELNIVFLGEEDIVRTSSYDNVEDFPSDLPEDIGDF